MFLSASSQNLWWTQAVTGGYFAADCLECKITKKPSLASSTWFIFMCLIFVFCTLWLWKQCEKCQKNRISTLTGRDTQACPLMHFSCLNLLIFSKPLHHTYKTTSGTTTSYETLQSLHRLKLSSLLTRCHLLLRLPLHLLNPTYP